MYYFNMVTFCLLSSKFVVVRFWQEVGGRERMVVLGSFALVHLVRGKCAKSDNKILISAN